MIYKIKYKDTETEQSRFSGEQKVNRDTETYRRHIGDISETYRRRTRVDSRKWTAESRIHQQLSSKKIDPTEEK